MNRRRHGSTLALVAIVTLVVCVIGVGIFVLTRVLGGGRELMNATDSGTLNAAKQAMAVPSGPVPLEFSQCTVPPSSPVTLQTYNRLVAQAFLVALNAEAQGTGQTNAAATLAAVETIGSQLRASLSNTPNMQGFFNNLTSQNSAHMNDAGATDTVQITQAFMKHGESTNVYFDPNTFPNGVTIPSNLYSNGSLTGPNGAKYMRGYEGITVGGEALFGVPVFPGNKPHLVSLSDFTPAVPPPNGTVPPNSFRADNKAHVHKGMDYMTGAVAAAIVGVVSQNVGTTQFPAAIPGGYLELVNLPGQSLGGVVSTTLEGAAGVFNNELYTGIDVSNNVSGGVQGFLNQLLQPIDPAGAGNIGTSCFSTLIGEVAAWAKYNKSQVTKTVPDPQPGDPTKTKTITVKDDNLRPDKLGYVLPPNSTLRWGGTAQKQASLAQAEEITSCDRCSYKDYYAGMGGLCATNLANFVGNYATKMSNPGPAFDTYGLLGVECVKGKVLSDHYAGLWSSTMLQPGISGLNKFDHNAGYPNKVPFSAYATPYELLVQVGGCSVSTNGTLDQLYQRACQIVPGTTRPQFNQLIGMTVPPLTAAQDALRKQKELKMGHKMYVYRQGDVLVMNETKPLTFSNSEPDGIPPNPDGCKNIYNCLSGQANAYGDGAVHDRPYTIGGACTGIDRALWTPSTGAKNMLGRVVFSSEAQTSGVLASPN